MIVRALSPEEFDASAGRLGEILADAVTAGAGVVILKKAWAPNQPHRGEVAKLLVHRDFRRLGIGTLLMQAVEAKVREMGLMLITFDSVAHAPVEAFYRRLGYGLRWAYSGLCAIAVGRIGRHGDLLQAALIRRRAPRRRLPSRGWRACG